MGKDEDWVAHLEWIQRENQIAQILRYLFDVVASKIPEERDAIARTAYKIVY